MAVSSARGRDSIAVSLLYDSLDRDAAQANNQSKEGVGDEGGYERSKGRCLCGSKYELIARVGL